MNYIRAYCRQTDGEPGTPIRFVASTEGQKRDGKNLAADRWLLENYRKNPVVLWVHDYQGKTLPVGRAVVEVADRELVADVTFDQEDEFATQVESKYRRGYLNAVSVGWQDVAQGRQVYYDLMDVSAVPVPADPDALKRAGTRAAHDLLLELAGLVGREAPGMTTIGNWLEAGIHSDFTGRADYLFSEGHIDRDERIALSGAIGTGLDAFAQGLDEIGDLRTRPLTFEAMRTYNHRGAIPPHSTEKAPEDAAWDGPGEVAKAEATEGVLRRMHAWVDSDADPDTKRAYKLPHHTADGLVVWRGAAASMARLFQANTQIPDSDRRGTYNHLARHYQQFDKEPPEFRAAAELALLSDTEIRGMFLEGEEQYMETVTDIRAGAVLSGRNRGDLEQAVKLVSGVLERASPNDTDEGERAALEMLRAIHSQLPITGDLSDE